MAFRVVRQRREARRNAKLDEIFQVGGWGRGMDGLDTNSGLAYLRTGTRPRMVK